MFVAHHAVAEIHLARQSGLDHEFQNTVNGGLADRRIALFDNVVKLLGRQMLLALQEGVKDHSALRRSAQMPLDQIGFKYFLFAFQRCSNIEMIININ